MSYKICIWQDTSSQSSIFINCFWWGCLIRTIAIASNAHNPSQMQGMDRKHGGHARCLVITTNIKNNFGLNFRKACCLGHLCCVQCDYENFVHFGFHNEIFWCGEHLYSNHKLTLTSSTSLLRCKFCHVFPLCIVDYNGQIYCVVHQLQSISRMVIHLGVHKHHVANGKCKEFVDKTRRLIVKEVDRTLDAKIFVISMNANFTLLVKHMFDDGSDDIMEHFNGEQLKHI